MYGFRDRTTLDTSQAIYNAANSYFENLLSANFLPSFPELQEFIPNVVSSKENENLCRVPTVA